MRCLDSQVDGGASESNNSVEVVLLAASRLVSALGGSEPNDGDGVASQTNISGDFTNGNVKETQGLLDGRRLGVLNRLAALERTSVALSTGDGGVGLLGSAEGSQSKKSESRDTREHCEMSKALQLGAVRLDEN